MQSKENQNYLKNAKYINTKHNSTGITLIALVLTIIVLIILAGTTIHLLLGNNGVISKAHDAKKEMEVQEEIEILKLITANLISKAENENIKKETLISELDRTLGKDIYNLSGETPLFLVTYKNSGRSYKIFPDTGDVLQVLDIANLKGKKVNKKTVAIDKNNDIVIIPEGFNISKDSPEEVTKGLVVADTAGNEYVWIPIFQKNDQRTWGIDYSSVSHDKDYKNIEASLKVYTGTYASNNFSDSWYGDDEFGKFGYYNGEKFIFYTNGNMTEEEYNTSYQNILESVYINGGFYIGRYEMGIGLATNPSYALSISREGVKEYTVSEATSSSTQIVENGAPSIQGMPTPIIKENAVPYSDITQSQAQMLAEKIGIENNYGTTTSSLLYGVQWDAVCVFIENCDENNTASIKSQWLTSYTYAKKWGNYKSSSFTMDRGFFFTTNDAGEDVWIEKQEKTSNEYGQITTGASDQNSSLNIYDFAGNLFEWTLESSNDYNSPTVVNGSSYTRNSSRGASAARRDSDHITVAYFNIGGRIALYL